MLIMRLLVSNYSTIAGLVILAASLAGCTGSPSSDAHLSGLAPAAPAPAKLSSVVTLVDLIFVMSPSHSDAQLQFYASVNPDCSDRGGDDIRIMTPPQHGSATVERGPGFTSFAPNSIYARCMIMQHVGERVVYRRDPGFTGTDELTYEVYFPTGHSNIVHYKITAG